MRILAFIIRLILSLRYRVRIEGAEHLGSVRGALILPNHPALVDPLIISAWLWPLARMRPLVSERFVQAPFFGRFIRMVGSIPKPDLFVKSGPEVHARVVAAMRGVGDALRCGDNILLYPAGRLCQTGLEVIRSKGLRRILDERPETPLLLVRTRGLRGSMFSESLKARVPDLALCFLKGIGIALSNLLIFTPHRPVSIRIEPVPDGLAALDNNALNAFLESWYNAPGEEPISLVSYHRLISWLPVIEHPAAHPVPRVYSRTALKSVIRAIVAVTRASVKSVTADTRLAQDLGMDSIAVSECLMRLKHQHRAAGLELAGIETVGDLASVIGRPKPRTRARR